MSKAARIRELYAQGLGSAEIAGQVGCTPEYCRAVRLRDVPGSMSPGDKRYRAKDPEKWKAYARTYTRAWSRRRKQAASA